MMHTDPFNRLDEAFPEAPAGRAILVPIDQILPDPRLQMRAGELDWDFVDTLADVLAESGTLTPLTVFADDAGYYLADGFHRLGAYRAAQATQVPVFKNSGGFDAAFRFALGANADQNAKPRTRKDLRRAVEQAIINLIFSAKKGEEATQTEIAEICKTTQGTVSNVFRALKKAANGETRPAPSAPPQLDFFGRLNEDFSPAYHGLDRLLQDERWLDETVPTPEKIEGLQGLIARLAEIETKAKDKLNALKEGAAHA